jgi:hypothetical protein
LYSLAVLPTKTVLPPLRVPANVDSFAALAIALNSSMGIDCDEPSVKSQITSLIFPDV